MASKKRLGGMEVPAEMLGLITMVLEENPEQDFLGSMFMRLELGNHWKGQFFTPYSVCKVMAEMNAPDLEATIEAKAGYQLMTLLAEQVQHSSGSAKEKRKYQLHSRIRGLAQKVYNASSKPKHCINCGYKKHYEVAHIKAISTFDDNTPISVINDIENLMALCPNCHWEYDNGILALADICGCSSTG